MMYSNHPLRELNETVFKTYTVKGSELVNKLKRLERRYVISKADSSLGTAETYAILNKSHDFKIELYYRNNGKNILGMKQVAYHLYDETTKKEIC